MLFDSNSVAHAASWRTMRMATLITATYISTCIRYTVQHNAYLNRGVICLGLCLDLGETLIWCLALQHLLLLPDGTVSANYSAHRLLFVLGQAP